MRPGVLLVVAAFRRHTLESANGQICTNEKRTFLRNLRKMFLIYMDTRHPAITYIKIFELLLDDLLELIPITLRELLMKRSSLSAVKFSKLNGVVSISTPAVYDVELPRSSDRAQESKNSNTDFSPASR